MCRRFLLFNQSNLLVFIDLRFPGRYLFISRKGSVVGFIFSLKLNAKS